MKDINRRDFIKLTGSVLGGVLLTGCGLDGGSKSGSDIIALPNGYKFYRLKSAGDSVGPSARSLLIDQFGGSVHISSGGVVTFDAYDKKKRHGMFQLDVDFAGEKPFIEMEHTALLTGETLADKRTVRSLGAHDVNAAGDIAAALHADGSNVEQHYGAGLYLDESRAGFQPGMRCGHEIDPGKTESNGIIGDVALCEDNGILVVASHTAKTVGAVSGQSLVHMPWKALSNSAKLMTTGDYLNGTEYQLAGFGIVDVGGNANFSVSSHTVPSTALLATSKAVEDIAHHCILSGYTWAPNDHRLFAAPPAIASSFHEGGISFGPRVAGDGTVHTKVGGVDGNNEILVRGDQVIRRSDEAGPSGEKVISFTPGALGVDNSYYYTQYAEGPYNWVDVTLLAYNGSEHRRLLTTGNVLSDGGQPVRNIIFSTTTNHVDGENRIVMLCEFTDNSSALVVGIPV